MVTNPTQTLGGKKTFLDNCKIFPYTEKVTTENIFSTRGLQRLEDRAMAITLWLAQIFANAMSKVCLKPVPELGKKKDI